MIETANMGKCRAWLVLAAMTTSLSIILLDSSLLPVAFPTIQLDTHATPAKLNWMINAYFLTYATLVLAASKLSNRLGNRQGFCLGMGVFAMGSLVGGLAWTSDLLVSARIIQGLGAAFMAPTALAIIVETFPPSHRGRALGISVSFSSIFYALGPVIGGVVTEFFSWRLLFLFNIPITLLGIGLALVYVPKSKRVKESFHFPGFLCLASGILCLTVALMQGRAWGWFSLQIVFLFASSLFFFFLLIVTSRFIKTPFVNISLFKHPVYFSGIAILFGTQFLMTNALFWPILFQKIWGYTPVQTGLLILFATIPPIIASPFGGYLSDRIGPKLPVVIGACSFIFCFILFLLFNSTSWTIFLFMALISFGFGASLVMTPVGTTMLSHIPENKRMLATGFYSTVRFTGGTMGVATLGAIKSDVKYATFSSSFSHCPGAENVDCFQAIRSAARGATILGDGTPISPELSANIHALYIDASIHAFNYMNIASIFVAIIVLLLAYRSLKPYHLLPAALEV